ncbi:MAG: hypothetical protein ACE5EM_13335, partial [Sphingomonadales bacterium]
ALSEHINSGFQATLDSLTGQVAETIDELKRMEEGIMAALPAVRGTVGKVLRTISSVPGALSHGGMTIAAVASA